MALLASPGSALQLLESLGLQLHPHHTLLGFGQVQEAPILEQWDSRFSERPLSKSKVESEKDAGR